MKGPLELHVRDQVGSLALVGRDDTDLVGLYTGLDEPGSDRNNELEFFLSTT